MCFSFGTSIPIAAFPGIGASILIPVAAKLSAISSVKFTILLTLTPGLGCISYLVTEDLLLLESLLLQLQSQIIVSSSIDAFSNNFFFIIFI